MIAAERSGRLCRGGEIDPLYVDLIVRRFEEVTGKPVTLEETGETFAALRERRAGAVQENTRDLPAPLHSRVGDESAATTPAADRFRKRTRMRPPTT